MLQQVAMPKVSALPESDLWVSEQSAILRTAVKPRFSKALVLFMMDLSYEQLRKRLQRKPRLVEMLDGMYLLMSYLVHLNRDGLVMEINNQHVGEIIGRLSYTLEFPAVWEDFDE